MINPYKNNEGQYIPITGQTFFDTDGNEKPIEILELLDNTGHVKKWKLLQEDVIKANHSKDYFNVGELTLDFINKAVEILKYKKNTGLFPSGNEKEILSEEEFKDARDAILNMLIFHRSDDDLMDFLYEGCVDTFHNLGDVVEIAPFGSGTLSGSFDGLTPGHLYLVHGNLEFSFMVFDFYNVINNKSIVFNRCKHCEHIFIQNRKNQKYCPDCRAANIPEKEKKRSDISKLKQSIYNRLYARDAAGKSIEYSQGLKNHFDFTDLSKQKKEELSNEEYFNWLKEMDNLTK